MTFGGWSIDVDLYNWLLTNVPEQSTILELGSGFGTSALVKHWNVFSVEENPQWVNAYHNQYIYAPIKNDWYDRQALKVLPDSYDVLLVDGPAHGTRTEMNKYLDVLKLNTSGCKFVIFDDVDRPLDLSCYKDFLQIINSYETDIISTTSGKAFAFIKLK